MVSKNIQVEVLSYTERKDEDIIKDIQDGDFVAQDYILDKYKPLVKSRARAYFIIGADRDDIVQEGMIGLYKAIRDYQGDKNASFHGFADLCISRQIITAIKTATRQKHMPLNSYISLNKPLNDEDSGDTYLDYLKAGEKLDPETVFIGKENKDYIEKNINQILSGFELKVLNHYLTGKSYTEIAKLIDKSEKSVDNALQRIKKKVEKFMEEQNKNNC